MRPSTRASAAVILFAAATLAALLFSPAPGWPWRALTASLAIMLGWGPTRTILLGRSPKSVHHAEWHADGAWLIYDCEGRSLPVVLSPASVTLGSWLLLMWIKPDHKRRFYALIDAAHADAATFRALKGRLNC